MAFGWGWEAGEGGGFRGHQASWKAYLISYGSTLHSTLCSALYYIVQRSKS